MRGTMTTATTKKLSEEAIQELEAQIPALAAMATRMAYDRAKQTGNTLVVSKGGLIVAEYPDGTERTIAVCKPKRKVTAGVPFTIGKLLR